MKKVIGIFIVIGMALAIAGTVSAHGPWGSYGMGYGKSIDIGVMQKFRSETLSLRDRLTAKYLELMNEYNRPEPNTKRISAFRKEIIDLDAKIQAIAEKYNIPMGGMMMRICPMGWW